MTESIQSVNLAYGDLIENRAAYTTDYVRSISVNQSSGDFIVSLPLLNDGTVRVYPQSPNNPSSSLIGEIKSITGFSGYGVLSLPVDARYDSNRNKIWIADMGNKRVLKVNSGNYLVDFSIDDITLPYSVVPNINNGGVFIKSFISVSTGVIYYYSMSGTLISSFTFDETFKGVLLTPSLTRSFLDEVPLPATMVFDHTRSRLWFTAGRTINMVDLNNSQVITLTTNYTDSRGIDVDVVSGNAFATMKSFHSISNRWYIVQIFRDNNEILSTAYVPDNVFVN